MSKKTRLIIVIFCVISFFIIAPILVAYSMGYRYDFEGQKIVATGGIYVRTFPAADKITVDAQSPQKPSMFGNSVFVQNLLPKQHSVLIEKADYATYKKTLAVTEKEVTKLENIILFKDSILYQKVSDNVQSFSISPDKKSVLVESANTKSLDFYYFNIFSPGSQQEYSLNLAYASVLDTRWSDDSSKVLIKTQSSAGRIAYYLFDLGGKTSPTSALPYLDSKSSDISFNPQDSNQIFYTKNNSLYSVKNNKSSIVLEGVASYKIYDGSILWTSLKGEANKSDMSGKNVQSMSAGNSTYFNYAGYKIDVVSGKIFFTSPYSLLVYAQDSNSIDQFNIKANDYKLAQSPDWKKMAYYNGSQIYLYEFEKPQYNKSEENNIKIFSARDGETITNCYWLNNDYIIFQSGNRIITSEIDYRGNINTAEIAQTYPAGAESKSSQMIFDQNDSKIYILSNNILYSSEKLVP